MKKLKTASGTPDARSDLGRWAEHALLRLDGRPVVASVSGGKDSTALCLLLREADIEFFMVHMDTGWEHEDTESYVRDYLPAVFGQPITILQSEAGGMEELVKKKGMFPSRARRFCTQKLKVEPFQAYMAAFQEEGEDPVNVVGIRALESQARSQLPEWEWSETFDCEVWRPLIDWTEQDVIDLHRRHGVQPNPLYLRGATRVGCYPCIFARKLEVRMIADLSPERIDRLERLEREVADSAAARYAERGETFESLGYKRPTWFQNPRGTRDPETGERRRGCMPICKVVEWSRTKHGSDEPEPFMPPYHELGCARWGLCSTIGVVPGENEGDD